ncbi:MAG: SDR family NAD(P)-dependent oxidoreductase [Azospirillaceae bacterium]
MTASLSPEDHAKTGEVALVVGVGPGLGRSLCAVFAEAGMTVAAGARDVARLNADLDALPADIRARITAYPVDVTVKESVDALVAAVRESLGVPDLVVYNAGTHKRGGLLEIEAADLEAAWRSACLGAFHVAQAAVRAMAPRESGTLLFTGATASLRGGAGFINLAVPKFGLRALAQSIAREYQPQGLHVAHVVVDGQIDGPKLRARQPDRDPATTLDRDAMARTYLALHRQDKRAWTQEIDLRPAPERF